MNADGLRPIRGPIVPGFWEQNWPWAIPALAVALALALVLALWIRRRLRRPRVPTPLESYRTETEAVRALLDRGETAEIPARLSRILREYIESATGVRAPEQTTEEFLALGGADATNGPASVASPLAAAGVPGSPSSGPAARASADATNGPAALPPESVEVLRPFLTLADQAKFARRSLETDECRELLARADRFVAACEERRSAP